MPDFNKSLIMKFKQPITYVVPDDLVLIVVEKLDEFQYLKKTDGRVFYIDEHTVRRNFVDQEAVDEWVTFIKDVTLKYDFDIDTIQVENL